MPIPWFRVLDVVIGVTDIARSTRSRPAQPPPPGEQLAPGTPALGHLEARLAGVVVAALKEAFDRDTRRLELEREQLEAERARVDRALRLELLRQAGGRGIGRLRVLARVALSGWPRGPFFSARV